MNAPETEEAAVKIQAAFRFVSDYGFFFLSSNFRGHQVRKEMSGDEPDTAAEPAAEEATEAPATAEPAAEEIDIDLNDPQTEEAAVKIQVRLYSLINSFLTLILGSFPWAPNTN